ncbi:LysM peptidoglycan-binding domain-containing protein [Devosia albogilva]|uniref:LysM peptidoglycan-binding domain-containing protein n=1 Tax=Devosia albogilva TaxID=429726 RepID=A0ABW5QKS9_9HYPH
MLIKLVRASVLVALLGAIPGGWISPAFAESSCGTSVRVQPGDTLFRIAARCGVSISEILRANPNLVDPNYIKLGMTLRLPGRVAPDEPSPTSSLVRTHRVRPGETLSIIARRFNVSLRALIAANRDLGNPNILRVGDVIRIPSRHAGSGPDLPVPPGVPNTITVVGTLTDEGATCQAMRGDDGRLYTLVGNAGYGRSGERVQLLANPIQYSFCQQGTTLEVVRVRRLDPPAPPPNRITVVGTITDEGVECQALRDHSGQLYTLTGNVGRIFEGETVRVEGRIAEVSFCQQGTTIDVQVIEQVRR